MPRCLSICVLLLVSIGSTSCECWFRHCKNTVEIVADDPELRMKVDVVAVADQAALVAEFGTMTAYDWWNAPKHERAKRRDEVHMLQTFYISNGKGTGPNLPFLGYNRKIQTGHLFVFADFKPDPQGSVETAKQPALKIDKEVLDNTKVIRLRVTRDTVVLVGNK